MVAARSNPLTRACVLLAVAACVACAAQVSAEPGELIRVVYNPFPDDPDGLESDGFGFSIAVAGRVIAIGTPFDNNYDWDTGSVFFYDGVTGQRLGRTILPPEDVSVTARFGYALAAHGTVVAAGKPRGYIPGMPDDSVYLLDADPKGNPGAVLAKIQNPHAGLVDGFGKSIDIDETRLLVGAPDRYMGATEEIGGEVFLFDRLSLGEPILILGSPIVHPSTGFGADVALDGDVIAVLANMNPGGSGRQGIHLYDAAPSSPNFGKLIRTVDAAQGEFDGLYQLGPSISTKNGFLLAAASLPNSQDETAATLIDNRPRNYGFGSPLAIYHPTFAVDPHLARDTAFSDRNFLFLDQYGSLLDIEPGGGLIYICDSQPGSPNFGKLQAVLENPLYATYFGGGIAFYGNNVVVGIPDAINFSEPNPRGGIGAVAILEGPGALRDSKPFSDTVPAILATGQELFVGVTMENDGETLWNAKGEYRLSVAKDTCDLIADGDPLPGFEPDPPDPPGPPDAPLFEGDKTRPGEKRQFVFRLKAHELPGCCCELEFRMTKAGQPFGGSASSSIEIVLPPNASSAWTAYD